jgi:hypothetical protein
VRAIEGLLLIADLDIGPGAEEDIGVLARSVDIEAMGILFDHGNLQALLAAASAQELGDQRGLARPAIAADCRAREWRCPRKWQRVKFGLFVFSWF